MKSFLKKLSVIVCTVVMALNVFACGGNKERKIYDNETDILVMSTLECDRVFNPFFSTSATDSNVAGMTQISMLGNDKDGNPTCGEDEPVAALDYEICDPVGEGEEQTTTYYFVLKNNVRFSNNTPLTIKDVLFNYYVYLDNAYTGAATIYSTDIVGLKEYRTQETTETEQEKFMDQFKTEASTRIQALVDAHTDIYDEHTDETITDETFRAYLKEYAETNQGAYTHIEEDYKKALELFDEELNNDWSGSLNAYEDMKFEDKNKKVYANLFSTDVEVFLYNEGLITWNRKEGKLEYTIAESMVANLKNLEKSSAEGKEQAKQQAIDLIKTRLIPSDVDQIVQYYATATTLDTFLTNDALEKYSATQERRFKNISGIRFANRTQAVTVNNKEYKAMTADAYNADGSPKDGYNEVLSITIHKVDPKAIWNFSGCCAPMWYYSDQAHIDAFDYEANFGVEYNSQTFMNDVVKNSDKIGVPMGAGAYAASKDSGGITNIASGDFYDKGVIYYERNPYFVLGPAKIKKVRYQVVASSQILNTLYRGDIDFAEPSAKPETEKELNDKGVSNKTIKTMGYGYIGINAGKVPSLKVRQAIMHAINTQECVEYYKTSATAIHRSMSTSSWAYPKGCTPYYPYIGGVIPENLNVVNPDYKAFVAAKGKKTGEKFTKAEQEEFIRGLIEGDGYTLNSNDVYAKGNNVCKYDFVIAGEETDHPAWNAMYHAGELLNDWGFEITVKTDAQALRKLSRGDLTVWAAAWSSTLDPDMYQVYHKESNASSVINWGYPQILRDTSGRTYGRERDILDDLSDLIDRGRETNVQSQRADIYSQALDLVMQLAVELPTYQRDDLFAYTDKLDETSLNADTSPFKGLLSDLHEVSLYTTK